MFSKVSDPKERAGHASRPASPPPSALNAAVSVAISLAAPVGVFVAFGWGVLNALQPLSVLQLCLCLSGCLFALFALVEKIASLFGGAKASTSSLHLAHTTEPRKSGDPSNGDLP